MSSGVGCRRGRDPAFLRLWCRPATAALIQPLVWELPYATGAALGRKEGRKERKKEECLSLLWTGISQPAEGPPKKVFGKAIPDCLR